MSNQPLSNVRKIAVLRPSSVGDFVFSLPCLHALKSAYPDARLVYIGQQWHAGFLMDRPGPVDEVAVIPPCPGVGLSPAAQVDPQPIQAFIDTMREAEFDLAVQIYGGGRYSNPFILSLGARLTIGMKAADAVPLDRWVSYGSLQDRRLQMLEVGAVNLKTRCGHDVSFVDDVSPEEVIGLAMELLGSGRMSTSVMP